MFTVGFSPQQRQGSFQCARARLGTFTALWPLLQKTHRHSIPEITRTSMPRPSRLRRKSRVIHHSSRTVFVLLFPAYILFATAVVDIAIWIGSRERNKLSACASLAAHRCSHQPFPNRLFTARNPATTTTTPRPTSGNESILDEQFFVCDRTLGYTVQRIPAGHLWTRDISTWTGFGDAFAQFAPSWCA